MEILITAAISSSAQSNSKIEIELLGHLNNLEKYSMYFGSRDTDALEKENNLLKKKLLKFGRMPSTLKFGFKNLAGKLRIVTSKDGKFRIYSWDSESGGTMHDYESVIQYRGKSGKTYSWTRRRIGDFDVGGFYHQIFQVNTKTDPIYLANSTFILSNPAAYQELKLFKIEGEKLNSSGRLIKTNTGFHNTIGFYYDFFSVVDRPERPIRLFYFDEIKKVFRFPVVLEDEQHPNGGRVTDKFIIYGFDGKQFVKAR